LYDGATQDEIDSLDEESGIKYSPDVRVKIIDFAHAITDLHVPDVINAPFPPSHPKNADRGYLKGLASLKYYFKMLFPACPVLTIGFGKKSEVTRTCLRD
jgi:Inositol polyphosphate kinase